MLDVYTDFAVNDAAIPVIPGRKSESEKFPGADASYSIEAMMGDRRALQSGTSHNLGQNFAKAFDIQYQDRNGAQAILLDDQLGCEHTNGWRNYHDTRRRSRTGSCHLVWHQLRW